MSLFSKAYFNPRSHEGSDCHRPEVPAQRLISIHAPTRGATTFPRPSWNPFLFQSTLPRGERLVIIIHLPFYCNFNPRSHEGSDGHLQKTALHLMYFNPRSHEGSDGNPGCRYPVSSDFNPRSHEGSDIRSQKMVKM